MVVRFSRLGSTRVYKSSSLGCNWDNCKATAVMRCSGAAATTLGASPALAAVAGGGSPPIEVRPVRVGRISRFCTRSTFFTHSTSFSLSSSSER